ncbi:MAG: SUMF1/EgtB/PvdO family nonheme iron enzyme [Desulfobacterales bacterium]|nr:SUMF1/EgtB/PvdO family nonheme iron enzyme [Desulfobacterales bacterium]
MFFINHGIHGNQGKRIKTKNRLVYKRSFSVFSVFLPTETEWEYACRVGSTTRFCFGDNDSSLGNYTWYGPNSGSKTHPVAQKQPIAWGLYDMPGTVGRRFVTAIRRATV